jgi:hypothetical protein
LELYEVSPVLHGANQLTGTISIKSDNVYNSDTKADKKCPPATQDIGLNRKTVAMLLRTASYGPLNPA